MQQQLQNNGAHIPNLQPAIPYYPQYGFNPSQDIRVNTNPYYPYMPNPPAARNHQNGHPPRPNAQRNQQNNQAAGNNPPANGNGQAQGMNNPPANGNGQAQRMNNPPANGNGQAQGMMQNLDAFPYPFPRPYDKLKPELFQYNDSTPISQYIDKLDILTERWGAPAVLNNFGIGILLDPSSSGARWFMSLSAADKTLVSTNLTEAKDKLEQRFKQDRIATMKLADNEKHSFADQTKSVDDYIDNKVKYYNEMGCVDEDYIACRVYDDLDTHLKVLVKMQKTGNTVQDLRQQVSTGRHLAMETWRKDEDTRKSHEKRLQDLERRLNPDRPPSRFGNQNYNSSYTRNPPSPFPPPSKTTPVDSNFFKGMLNLSKPNEATPNQQNQRNADDKEGKPTGFFRPGRQNNGGYRNNNYRANRPSQDLPRNAQTKVAQSFVLGGQTVWGIVEPSADKPLDSPTDNATPGDNVPSAPIAKNLDSPIHNCPNNNTTTLPSLPSNSATQTSDPSDTSALPLHSDPQIPHPSESYDPKQPFTVDDAIEHIEIRGSTIEYNLPRSVKKHKRQRAIPVYLTQDKTYNWESFLHLRTVVYTPVAAVEAFIDTCSPLCLVSREYLTTNYPDALISQLTEPITLTGIGEGPKIYHNTCLDIKLLDSDKRPWSVSQTVYIVDRLSCGMLLGLEFLKPHQLHIIWGGKKQNDELHIADTGRRIPLSDTFRSKPKLYKKSVPIRATITTDIKPGTGMAIPIQHPDMPVTATGYLIVPTPITDPTYNAYGSLMNAIVDGQDQSLHFANLGELPITIHKGQLLGHLEHIEIFKSVDAYLASPYKDQDDIPCAVPLSHILDSRDEDVDDDKDDRYGHGYPHNLPDPPDPEYKLNEEKMNIPHDWGPEVLQQIKSIIHKYSRLFRPELGRFNDGVKMPINFKDGVSTDDLNQRPYIISRRDRAAMDAILQPLTDAGVVEDIPLGQPCPVASPAFVVWRKGKPRVVVDLRKVNTKVVGDAYPLPRQDEILGAMHGSTVFTVVDVMKGFFQQEIEPSDRYKTAFVTPHRGHEQLTVATMGLKTSPGFFQHRMERLFRKYLWYFVLVYIDDVIIYSRTIEEHINHLDIILGILAASGCTMALEKCHFAQHGLKALGQHVSRLGLATDEKKCEAIRKLDMPRNLEDLEQKLRLMGFLRSYVYQFAGISSPLNKLKILGFKGCPEKANPARAR
ncbi:hypothetical protein O1611_g5767 [Lasiodiplodia mahajangana]|uniref:Uncharacterized protein n=1 Tax=Lasiodiplodia mahajangana TaxID=1108764 RepID=A0ACC2JKD4_9PEZI|nr:hypothetical protein O1611_g5767 [Lasiodiplodia mahajangana]